MLTNLYLYFDKKICNDANCLSLTSCKQNIVLFSISSIIFFFNIFIL